MTTANLSIQDNDTVDQYTSVGESSFGFTFPITAASELKVSKNNALLTYGVDWSLDSGSLNEPGGGSITLTDGSDPGDIITLWLDLPIKRTSGYSAGAATLLPEDLNADAANQIRIAQQLRRDIARCLRLPVDDPLAGQDMQLPIASQRLNKLPYFSAITGALELLELADVGGTTTALSSSLIATTLDSLKRTPAEITAGVFPTNNAYAPGLLPRYGAALDGVTDDTAALVAAIAQQQAGGAAVQGIRGKTLLVSSWSTVTTTAPLVIDGHGMTIECANATRVAFLTCEANFDIRGVVFDGFFRVISNPAGTGGAITEGRFIGNRCVNATAGANNNAYYLLISNPVQNLWIIGNRFVDALTTAVYIGENTYADQDDWGRIVVGKNVIEGVTCPAGPAAAFGILIYGRDVVIAGNDVSGVEGADDGYSASNGAYAIYTKARYSRIFGNNVRDVGLVTDADSEEIIGINIKGSDRADTSTPQGYAVVCALNTVSAVGTANTDGSGISCDHSDVLIAHNWLEGIGRRGIFAFGPVAAVGDYLIHGNVIRLAAGSNENGVEIVPGGTKAQVSHNIITAGRAGVGVRTVGAHGANVSIIANTLDGGTGIRLTAENYNLSNVKVSNNLLVSGTHGLFMQESGGGAISDLSVDDNNFTAASTAGIGGVAPATMRANNNRGYKTENCGVTGQIATGTTVAHGCQATPAVVLVTALEAGPTDLYVTSIGATNFTINFGGGGSYAFAWAAKAPASYA